MKKIVLDGLLKAAIPIVIGLLLGAGMRAAEWLIPKPETRIVVCMTDDFDGVACKPLVALMAAVEAKEKLLAIYCAGGRNISKTKKKPPVVEINQSADNDSNQQSQATGLIHGKDGYGTHG